MRAVGLIAADSIRALLHQRLLVALMLVTLGLTVVLIQVAVRQLPTHHRKGNTLRQTWKNTLTMEIK